jgi:hypothetical protein
MFSIALEDTNAFRRLIRIADELERAFIDKEKADHYNGSMDRAALLRAVADEYGLPVQRIESALERATAETTTRQTTARAKEPPRLKWEIDRLPDDNPATFAWRAYAAEAKAGTLHRGLIHDEDRKLYTALYSWLRSNDIPAEIDLPTKREWNARQLGALPTLRAKLRDDPTAQEVRRLEAVARRVRRSPQGTPII